MPVGNCYREWNVPLCHCSIDSGECWDKAVHSLIFSCTVDWERPQGHFFHTGIHNMIKFYFLLGENTMTEPWSCEWELPLMSHCMKLFTGSWTPFGMGARMQNMLLMMVRLMRDMWSMFVLCSRKTAAALYAQQYHRNITEISASLTLIISPVQQKSLFTH